MNRTDQVVAGVVALVAFALAAPAGAGRDRARCVGPCDPTSAQRAEVAFPNGWLCVCPAADVDVLLELDGVVHVLEGPFARGECRRVETPLCTRGYARARLAHWVPPGDPVVFGEPFSLMLKPCLDPGPAEPPNADPIPEPVP